MSMNRRSFLKAVGWATIAGAMERAEASSQQRPNIVFLLTDDQSYNSLGCMGNRQVTTPHFDELAADGVVFNGHYDTTSICMASRATIMTGQYEYRHGCNFTRGSLARGQWSRSYPVLLREAGYYTCFAGKFGFAVTDGPDKSGYNSNDKMPMDSFDVWHGWPEQGSYRTADNEFVAGYAEKYPHLTRALGAAARDFIRKAAKRQQPFCLSVSFKAPHGPLQPDPEFDDVYASTVWQEPPNYDEPGAAHLPKQAKSGRQYLKIRTFRPATYQKNMRKYHQQIYGVDYAIGMIRTELKRQGLADNTVIIATSDNGYNCGSHGFGGKVLPYEEGSRAPLIVHDPRQRSAGNGRRCRSVTGNIDIMPTLLDFAGLPIPGDVDGKSLRPLVRNPGGRVRDAMAILNVWGNIGTHELSVVTENYKYIYWFFAGAGRKAAEELYHLPNDRYEMNNLADLPERQTILNEMRLLYDLQIERWKKTCVQRNECSEWGTLLNRSVSWEAKEKVIPASTMRSDREFRSGEKTRRSGRTNAIR